MATCDIGFNELNPGARDQFPYNTNNRTEEITMSKRDVFEDHTAPGAESSPRKGIRPGPPEPGETGYQPGREAPRGPGYSGPPGAGPNPTPADNDAP